MFGGGSCPFETELWLDEHRLCRQIAQQRLQTDWLQTWWCRKYNRPRKDPLLAEYTHEELLIEWYEERIEIDPMNAHSQKELDAGLLTGDAVVDAWEKKIAKGKGNDIDFAKDLGLPEDKLAAWLSKPAKPLRNAEATLPPKAKKEPLAQEEFSDKYTED